MQHTQIFMPHVRPLPSPLVLEEFAQTARLHFAQPNHKLRQ